MTIGGQPGGLGSGPGTNDNKRITLNTALGLARKVLGGSETTSQSYRNESLKKFLQALAVSGVIALAPAYVTYWTYGEGKKIVKTIAADAVERILGMKPRDKVLKEIEDLDKLIKPIDEIVAARERGDWVDYISKQPQEATRRFLRSIFVTGNLNMDSYKKLQERRAVLVESLRLFDEGKKDYERLLMES